MNRITISFFLCPVLLACSMSARADIDINETTFPDEEFRNWVLRQPYGQDGVLTEEEVAGVTTINVMRREVIQSLKGIEYFPAITKLVCEMNQLTELDLSKNTALTHLSCFGNKLSVLDLSKNKNLKEINCHGNRLTELDVSGCVSLTELDCSSNQLTTLNVSGCKALTSLKCHINHLTTLDLPGCTSIETVWCNDNDLISFDVTDCTSLTTLWCHNNQLSEVNVSKNTKLKLFRCYDNQLTSLNLSNNYNLYEIWTYHNLINGEAMDALIENLPTVSKGNICSVFSKDEQGVMTTMQVAAARAKGWIAYYFDDTTMRWQEYEGCDLLEPVTFTTSQMATIILPSEPEAGKGKYYRLDRVEGNEIVFEQEQQPRAHVPYIIVPFEDFSIDPGELDLAGLNPDTVSVDGISFIGTFAHTFLPSFGGDGGGYSFGGEGGGFIYIIDQTPDCGLSSSMETEKGAFIGTLRAYLTWHDPYNPGGAKGPEDEMKIVLHDKRTGSLSPDPSPMGEGRNNAAIYDLGGRKMVNGKWLNGKSHGLFFKDGKKWVK